MSNRIYISEKNIPTEVFNNDFIFDTNVWLSIYGLTTDNSNPQTRIYSNLYKLLLQNEKRIFLLGTITSEYIHRSLKLRYDTDSTVNRNIKIHQQTNYKSWIKEIADEVSYLVDDCIQLDDGFAQSNPEEMCRTCMEKTIDYNDLIISDACRKNSITLVTDDRDFSCENINIVTRNKKLT
ncbi:hypothetical protein Amal_02865 [Acetobacter malorum]|uniref:Uncharacterized protein n=1 Tax=Acetobacter malorum TaxID=178901 RepID=A0A177G7I0_9PROT|nr:PIN domain-containing protein [Acetobacter malorum]OAG75766.1 hypothetical protein Amal_02865 [Acetobacter malorum]